MGATQLPEGTPWAPVRTPWSTQRPSHRSTTTITAILDLLKVTMENFQALLKIHQEPWHTHEHPWVLPGHLGGHSRQP